MIALTFKTIDGRCHRVCRVRLNAVLGIPNFWLIARCGAEVFTPEIAEDTNDGSLPPTCDECLGVAHLHGWKPHPIDASLYYKGDLSGDCVLAPEAELLEQWKRSRGR